MITHIVMFKFKEAATDENINKAKEHIESLMSTVPSLNSMEVGVNFADEERAMDMSLVSRFDDKEALGEYAVHPTHLKVIEFIKSMAQYSKVVDYET